MRIDGERHQQRRRDREEERRPGVAAPRGDATYTSNTAISGNARRTTLPGNRGTLAAGLARASAMRAVERPGDADAEQR